MLRLLRDLDMAYGMEKISGCPFEIILQNSNEFEYCTGSSHQLSLCVCLAPFYGWRTYLFSPNEMNGQGKRVSNEEVFRQVEINLVHRHRYARVVGSL